MDPAEHRNNASLNMQPRFRSQLILPGDVSMLPSHMLYTQHAGGERPREPWGASEHRQHAVRPVHGQQPHLREDVLCRELMLPDSECMQEVGGMMGTFSCCQATACTS